MEGNRHLFAFQAVTLCDEVCGLALISGRAGEGAPLALHVPGSAGTPFLWVQPASPGMAELTARGQRPPLASLSPSHHTHPAETPGPLPASAMETSPPRPGNPSHGQAPCQRPPAPRGLSWWGRGPGPAGLHHPAAIGPVSGLLSMEQQWGSAQYWEDIPVLGV